jgi:hypothetical protein
LRRRLGEETGWGEKGTKKRAERERERESIGEEISTSAPPAWAVVDVVAVQNEHSPDFGVPGAAYLRVPT